MKATLRDADTLKSLDPNTLASYLRVHGWQQQREIPEKASIWTTQSNQADDQRFEILLPLNPTFQDFAIRMSEVLQTLEVVEQRSQIEILNTLISVLADVIDIRLTHYSFEDGTIPINNGVNLYRHARDMVLSAACSAIEQKPHFERKKPKQANDYIDDVRLGPSKKGSYILSVISPLLPNQRHTDDSDPFQRKVIKKLVQSLETTLSFAEEHSRIRTSIDAFDELVEYGVSANLCDALVGIHRTGKERGLEISLDWSPAIPMPQDSRSKIIFPPQVMPFIARIGKRLKAEVYKDYELTGEIIKLERQRIDEAGRVTLLAQIDGSPRKVKIELTEADYKLAATANQERKFVVCRGSLIKEGRIFSLDYLQNFSIVQ